MSTELTPIPPAGGEIVATSENTLNTLERASIDMQIATAHAYPRSMTRFKERAIEIATLDEETAKSCIYRREVGKEADGTVQYAEGMSVRMAEIVSTCYGNLRVGARIISQTERHVVAQGVAHDLESNLLCTSEVVESTVNKYGKPYSERMRVTVAKAALAKARRDAIFQVVPKALARPVEAAVRKLLFGQIKSVSEWRERINQWVSKLPIDSKRVWYALGISGADDLSQELIEQLIGIKTALSEGGMSLDDAFPEIETQDEKPKTATAKLESLRQTAKKQKSKWTFEGAQAAIKAATSIPELDEIWQDVKANTNDEGSLSNLWADICDRKTKLLKGDEK